MKIDIEGHEFRLFPTLIENLLLDKVKQLVLEVHSPGDIQLYPDYFRDLGDITHSVMFDLLTKINKTHTLVHFHANNGCQSHLVDNILLPNVFECTYIRNDFITKKDLNRDPLPTIYDMCNISGKPDYILKGFPYSEI